MKMRLIILMVFVLSAVTGYAQKFSNRGRDFWVGYGLHYFMELGQDNSQQMVLYFSAEEAANVKVTIKGNSNTTVQNYFVPANSVISSQPMPKSGSDDCRLYDLPPAYGGGGTSRVFSRSIHIESDVPVVAYAHISGAGSSGATMLMPVESWGYSYFSVNSQQALRGVGTGDGAFSWLFVVADHDNTMVEITPSVPLRSGAMPGVPFTATLNRGDIYQVVGAASSSTTGYDLTGTKVKSIANAAGGCYPVGVFAGSSSTLISCNGSNTGFADNLIQQIFPTQAWGKTYLTAPFSSSLDARVANPSIFRVAVKDPATIVKKNGAVLTGLINGAYYQYISTTADYIEADKPILVTQYIPSMTDGANNSCNYQGLGDPEMVYLSPVEQSINNVGFYRNTATNVEVNYLTLIIPTTGLNSLTIDGGQLFSNVYSHPNKPGYSVVVKGWNAAQAQCLVRSDSAFTAVTYGLGLYDSYAYNAGTYINNLNGTLSLHNTEGTAGAVHPHTCRNSPVELSVLISYQPTKLVWHVSELLYMTPNADVTQNNPVPSGTVQHNGITYYKYTLPTTYRFSEAGTFRFTINSTHPSLENCNNTEALLLDVVVKDMGKAATFTDTHSGCTPDEVTFKWDPSYAGVFTINQWQWNFPDGSTGNKDTAKRVFTTAGLHDVQLKVISAEGCVADTTIKIRVDAPSVMAINATPLAICENGTVDFSATATGAGSGGINGWYWDFGNNQTSTLQAPQDIAFTRYGTYNVKLVGKAGAGCISDTATQLITVYANPSPLFDYPVGCLPTNGMVNFQSKATAADGSAIAGHTWDFGDPNATPGNPNTANIANPSHNYQVGNYDIRYGVTTDKGCSKDTLVKAAFNPKPLITFGALPDVCENASPVSVATAQVTNGVPGTGIYKGPGVTLAGIFTPSRAGSGTHTIWYVYATAAGCIDSISTTVNVLQAPQASFTITEGVCLGNIVSIADQSQAFGASLTRWDWNFGDNSTVTYNNNNPFTKNYTTASVYTVGLIVTDSRGCASNKVMKVTTVHPLPQTAFTPPPVICMPKGSAAFNNLSTISDGTALRYEWDFGDRSAIVTAQHPTHVYAVAASYTVSLKTTSAFGCSNSTATTVSKFTQQPVAAFSMSPEIICQGADAVFTDESTSPAGTINGWHWEFGDGTTSFKQHVIKKYLNAATYIASITVANTAGCHSDTLSKQVVVHIQPVVDAGPSFVVAEGTVVTFNPTVNENNLVFKWTPGGELSNPNMLHPSFRAMHDQTFMLTATDGTSHCSASDTLSVKILRPVKVPNAFSPNGDGINDTWVITNLTDYQGNVVEVFNRYGQRVLYSNGYGTPWDGRVHGNPLPVGVYYYIIDLKNGFGKITGSITILR
ncbi:MAG TPA: PKD domain-containing protein [Niastella sp.]